MTSFTYSKETAKEESFQSGPISKTGDYLGRITQAYETVSTGGAVGLALDIVSDQGQRISHTIWHISKAGDTLDFGVAAINSLMSALSLRELKPKQNTIIQKWDFDTKSTKDVKVTGYPQLIDKHLGFVVQMVEYYKWKDGHATDAVGERGEVIRFFDADTRQTSSEKADGIDAAILDAWLPSLPVVKMLPGSRGAQIVAQAENKAPMAQSFSAADDDEWGDAPF
ncbi:MAG: hypothetical protein WC449_05775 [Candidatus Paceibacterota bacterium]